MEPEQLERRIAQWVERHRDEAAELAARLVRMESVNHPPTGNEWDYQHYMAEWLKSAGAAVDMYHLADVEGLREHPAYMNTRSYDRRPNVVGAFFGSGNAGENGSGVGSIGEGGIGKNGSGSGNVDENGIGSGNVGGSGNGAAGRSLMFSGHADTVYEGTEPWTHPPFSGHIEDGKLYGRGAYDMKGGMAAAMMAVKCVRELDIPIRGAVYIESVVDEEHGGANGTLAGRLRGPHADMAVIPEPSNMKIYPAHLGGGIWKARFTGKSGIGFAGEELVSALEAAVAFAQLLREYNAHRKERLEPPAWWKGGRLAEVTLLSIHSGDANRELQEKLPAEAELNFWIEGYPGMTGEEIIADLRAFFAEHAAKDPALKSAAPDIVPLIRYLSGSEMRLDDAGTSFLRTVSESGERVLGYVPDASSGSPFACDGFMFNVYSSTPALILGPAGGNAHAADEFLSLASYEQLIRWYAQLIVEWCGTAEAR